MTSERKVRVLRSESTYVGKQGLTYATGVTARTVGARGLCLTLTTMPPGARAKAHHHDGIETAVYVIAGEGMLLYGEQLGQALIARAGEYVFVPAGVPHAPFNRSDAPCTFAVAHSSGDDQEGSVMCPDLDTAPAAMPTREAIDDAHGDPQHSRPHRTDGRRRGGPGQAGGIVRTPRPERLQPTGVPR